MTRHEYKSRKFILALLGLTCSCALVWFDKISGTEFVSFNGLLGGAYMTANAYLGGKKNDGT